MFICFLYYSADKLLAQVGELCSVSEVASRNTVKLNTVKCTDRAELCDLRMCVGADIVALAAAVTELLGHTRRARTALWCAVQLTSAECVAAALSLTDSSTPQPNRSPSSHGIALPLTCR